MLWITYITEAGKAAALGQHDKAEHLCRLAIDETKSLNPYDPQSQVAILVPLIVLANLYEHQRKYDAAEPLYKRVLQIKEKSLGSDSLEVASALGDLAALYRSKGDGDAAQRLAKRALAIYQRASVSFDNAATKAMTTVAHAFQSQGDCVAAEAILKNVVKIKMKALGTEHREVGVALLDLAKLHVSQGNIELAARFTKLAELILDQTSSDGPTQSDLPANAARQVAAKPRKRAVKTRARRHRS